MSLHIILWLIIGIAALAVDVSSSMFLLIWFTIGSIAAIIAALLQYSFAVQLITFISVSAVFVAVGFPLVKKTIKRTVAKTPTREQSYIGIELTVDENVVDKASIRIDGIYWTVKNDGEPIMQGDRVRVIGIEGNKLVIRKI